MSDAAAFVCTVDTHYSDVDINGHINSVKYIEHILDLWPLDWYKYHAVKRFDVAYVAEAHAGDVLHFFGSTVDNATFAIRVTRTSGNQSRDEGIEVCRCHVSFVDHES
jgi:acyl-ACP thioesterase